MPPTTNVADKPEVMTGDELSAIEPPKSQNNRIWLSKVMMPIPYGYVVSAMSTVCFAFSSPGQSSTIGIFTDDMIVDLGLSRTELSSLFAAATLCSAALLALPFVGRSLDRFGPSIFSLVVTVLLAAACAAMAEVSGSAALFGCFLAVRFLGQGCEECLQRAGLPVPGRSDVKLADGTTLSSDADVVGVIGRAGPHISIVCKTRQTFLLSKV